MGIIEKIESAIAKLAGKVDLLDKQISAIESELDSLRTNKECLCNSCQNNDCNGLYVQTKHNLINPEYTVTKCKGYKK